MHKLCIFTVLILILLCGCDQQGPVTHAQAYIALKKAYHNGNNSQVESLLSANSMDYIQKICLAISHLGTGPREYMAYKLGIKPEELENISPDAYLDLYMKLNNDYSKDMISFALENDPIAVKDTDTLAMYKMPNNVTLYFVREEPYWKFDLEKSSR